MNKPIQNLARYIALIQASAALINNLNNQMTAIRPIIAELNHNMKAAQAISEADFTGANPSPQPPSNH